MSEVFFRTAVKTYIENWPHRLYNESIATALFQLTQKEMDAVIETNAFTIEETGKEPSEESFAMVSDLAKKITEHINRFPKGAYVKLGSRSPKDSYIGFKEGFCCQDGQKVIRLFNDSERVKDDLESARRNGYLSFVAVREWIDMPEWAEFRGFFKNKRLIGLSQYNYRNNKAYPEILENADSIQWAMQYKSEQMAELLPVSDIVADFFYKVRAYGNERVSEVVLIEVNPFDIWTDPCLFNWNKDSFDSFEFRYNNNMRKTDLSL